MSINIQIRKEEELTRFLEIHNFQVDDLGNGVYRVIRDNELPIFINVSESNIYFELDLGNISELASQEFYFNLLDLNTEILPVSFGINNSNPDDPRLVLVETHETCHLSDNELLSVFDAVELAADKAEKLLSSYINEG